MILEVDELVHRYGTEPAVDGVSFGIESGEILAVLGPSGCGKTTLVQAIAGHLQPTAGRIRLRGGDVTDVPPETRRVGLVFQESTLFPHLTVAENVAYGLRARDVDREEREATVSHYLELVSLEDCHETYPAELSGGQRRRVELARALAPQPDVLLLDEPLSALDRSLRVRLREEIRDIQRKTGVTTLFVTHDQEEAMALADRLVVMDDGEVAGIGRSRELYESPPDPFVASFLGRSSRLEGTLTSKTPPTVALGDAEIRVDSVDGLEVGDRVSCHVRPETVSLRDKSGLTGEVREVADVGRRYDLEVRLETGDVLTVECRSDPPEVGERIGVDLEGASLTVFPTDGCVPVSRRH